MRTRSGWALAVLGGLCALLGVAVMVTLGPDSRFSTGPHKVNTDGIAVVTAPKVITWADVRVDVLAEVPVRKPIFVGLGNSVDVQNLVGKTQRLEVTDYHTPWQIKTRQVKGRRALPGAPTALDWWLADAAGLGGASISTTLPDQTVSLAILSVGSTNLSGLQVTLAYGVEGGFAKGAGLLLLGSGGLLLGSMLRRDAGLWMEEDEDVPTDEDVESEEVVYIYVDEDGVEHEITPEEAESYEVIDVSEVEVEQDPAEESATTVEDERIDDEVAPVTAAPSVPGVLTAAEIAAGAPVPVSEGVAEVETEPETDVVPEREAERVVYVVVDEDGVEHEVGEDELGDFEILDEEEP